MSAARSLGEVLRTARTDKGLSLRDVQRRTGIVSGHLSQIETDTIAKPEMALLWELAVAYDLDFAELLVLAGHATGAPSSALHRRRMSVAMRAMSELTPADQTEVLRYMAELRARNADG